MLDFKFFVDITVSVNGLFSSLLGKDDIFKPEIGGASSESKSSTQLFFIH